MDIKADYTVAQEITETIDVFITADQIQKAMVEWFRGRFPAYKDCFVCTTFNLSHNEVEGMEIKASLAVQQTVVESTTE